MTAALLIFINLLLCLDGVHGAATTVNPAAPLKTGTLPLFRKSPKAIPWTNSSLKCGANEVADPLNPAVKAKMVLSCPAEGGKWAALTTPKSAPKGPLACYFTVYCIRDNTAGSGSICKSAPCLGTNERVVNYNSGANRVLDVNSIAKGAIRFTMDHKCDLSSTEEDGFIEAGNIWVNYALMEYQTNSKGNFKDPSDGADLYVKSPLTTDLGIPDTETSPGSVPYILTSDLRLTGKVIPCNSKCNYGSGLRFEVGQNNAFHTVLHVKDTCDWIMVCQQTVVKGEISTCDRAFVTTLNFKNNVVMLAGDSIAVPLTIEPVKSAGQTNNFGRIEVTYSTNAKISVTTSLRERVVAHTARVSNGIITLFLSNPDCLQFGVQGMGNGESIVTSKDDATRVDSSAPPVGQTVPAIPVVSIPPLTTTTGNPHLETAPPTTTQESKLVFTHNDPVTTWASLIGRRQGWLTWAIFYGFCCGSFLGTLVIALIFYLCRRTIFRSWYRGMYKRYHCDASGTTGGVTGADFGATTTGGATTVSNTTTGGTSTMTSTMSTTSGVTGGGTTGGGTTTGQSTLVTI